MNAERRSGVVGTPTSLPDGRAQDRGQLDEALEGTNSWRPRTRHDLPSASATSLLGNRSTGSGPPRGRSRSARSGRAPGCRRPAGGRHRAGRGGRRRSRKLHGTGDPKKCPRTGIPRSWPSTLRPVILPLLAHGDASGIEPVAAARGERRTDVQRPRSPRGRALDGAGDRGPEGRRGRGTEPAPTRCSRPQTTVPVPPGSPGAWPVTSGYRSRRSNAAAGPGGPCRRRCPG